MAYFLRTTDKDGKAHGGFEWPRVVGAEVVAPDWKPTIKCGNGLHGLLDGLGDGSNLDFFGTAIWWIVEADDAIDLTGKHKFERCKVIALGPRHEITAQLYAMRPGPIHGLCLTGGYYAKLTGGNYATLTGGDGATLIFLRWINGRHRIITAYVGEDGVEAGKAYKANPDHTAVVEV